MVNDSPGTCALKAKDVEYSGLFYSYEQLDFHYVLKSAVFLKIMNIWFEKTNHILDKVDINNK